VTFHVDLSGLKDLARVCKKVAPDVEKDLNRGIGLAGEVIAREARQNASFSSRIPGSIETRRRGRRVKIRAGGDAAPHAAVFEHGGLPGSFRHPVFGRDVWVEQAAHPFLTPALESGADEAFGLVVAAVDSALRGISVV